ncbi:MAG: hypothetical protein IKI97_13670 [Clostridia bacterium]|nr:hypothetical protein [Clostridia bacterium]
MKKILAILLAAVLLLSVVGCNKTSPDVPDNTDKSVEQNDGDGQLLHPDNYDEFLTDIYLCDDVYRSDNTPTHGTASIRLPMSQDVLELKDYQILLCGDGCPPESVVSRASQGYAPVYHVVPDGEIDGNFKVLKFKMEIPEGMLEDIKKQGVYEQIVEEIESQYYYLLVLDEKHYAYIHLERIEGAEKIETEAELADDIVKKAIISFEPKNEKLDLTIERVIRLAENKGEELTWSDFQMYNAIDTGSGLYILVYEIDETFDLMIGGGAPVSPPMYIRLVTKADRDNYIDIRTEDVEKFISENREEKSATETSELLCGYPKASYFNPITLESTTKDAVNETEHHVFIKEESEYTQYLLLQPSEELSDISLTLMELTDEGLVPGEKLYALDKLDVNKPLVVGVVFYGDFTTYGLSFKGTQGNECNYIIYTSGKDGSVILQKQE